MARVRVDFRDAERKLELFKQRAKNKLRSKMSEEITGSIKRGVSPVKGKGRFAKYSKLYLKLIKNKTFKGKKPSPVNLKLTGKLLGSIKVLQQKNGIRVIFDNFLADIHNKEGAGKSKTVRRMLPTNEGEEFSRSITMRMREVLSDVAKTIFKR